MNQNQNMSADINISKFIIRNTFAFRCYQSVLNMMPICKHLVFFLSIAYIYPFRDVGSEKNQQVQDNCSAANSNDGVEKIKVTNVFFPINVSAAVTKSITIVSVPDDVQRIYCCNCLLYTSPSPRDLSTSRMPSSA